MTGAYRLVVPNLLHFAVEGYEEDCPHLLLARFFDGIPNAVAESGYNQYQYQYNKDACANA